ncbi:ABC transporter ATP-binding protein [Hyphobacterium sp.]|uniref:ABC transporter ATP-binding protein n=1 Tax=Hyphobacterium sp. TaxID=2004662 RepID=UPI003B516745
MTGTVIETLGLTRRYGKLTAVDKLDLTVQRGQIYGFLGPNGAGKTTTIRMLLGLIRPDAGTAQIAGHDFDVDRQTALSRVGSMVESPALYLNLTGVENLTLTCRLKRVPTSDIARVLEIVDLTADGKRKVKQYSLGMRQRLGIARALLGQPDLLILDEPTNGLDPAGIREIRQLLAEAPQRFGTTILVSSHLLSEVEQMASHVGVMNKGRLLFQGTLPALMASAPHQLDIIVSDPGGALSLVASGHPEAVHTPRGVSIPGVTETEAAALNRRLVEAGHEVSGLALKPPALEDIFLQLTKESA